MLTNSDFRIDRTRQGGVNIKVHWKSSHKNGGQTHSRISCHCLPLSPGSDIVYIENGRINATQLEHFPQKRKRVNKVAKRTEYPRFGGSMKVFDIQWQNYDGEGKLGRRKALSRWDGYSPDSQSASPSSSLVCPCVIFYSTTKWYLCESKLFTQIFFIIHYLWICSRSIKSATQ